MSNSTPEYEKLDPNWQIHRPWEIQLSDTDEWNQIIEDINNARNMEKNLRNCVNCRYSRLGNGSPYKRYCCKTEDKTSILAFNVCDKWGWNTMKFEDRETV